VKTKIAEPTEITGAESKPSAIIPVCCPFLREIIALWERVAEEERRVAVALIHYFINA